MSKVCAPFLLVSVLSCPNPPFGNRPFTDFSSVTVLVFVSGEVLGGVIALIIPYFSLLHLDFFFDLMPAPLSVFFLGFNSTPFSSRFLFIEASFMCVAADGGSLVNLIGLPLLLGSFFLAMGSLLGVLLMVLTCWFSRSASWQPC